MQDAIDQARTKRHTASAMSPMQLARMLLNGMGGGPGGGGRGFGGRGGGGRGSFRNFNPTQPHGAIFYTGGNSALNTRGFFVGGTPPVTPSYNSNQYGITPLRLALYPRPLQAEHPRNSSS